MVQMAISIQKCRETAMRTREIATLNRDADIDFENKRVNIRNSKFIMSLDTVYVCIILSTITQQP